MKAGFFKPGIGGPCVAADHVGMDVAFIYASDPVTEKILQTHFPQAEVSCKSIGKQDGIKIITGCNPGPPATPTEYRQELVGSSLDLAVFFFGLAKKLGSKWLVWESSPQTLYYDKGNYFNKIQQALEKNGYGFAWRVLDAGHFGVPQTHNSLFVVGYLGDWRPPIAVLFDREEEGQHHRKGPAKRKAVKTLEELSEQSDYVLATQGPRSEIVPKSPKIKAHRQPNDRHYGTENDLFIVSPGINQIREMTPVEYLRLQGFSDGYLNIFGQVQPFSRFMCYGLVGSSSCTPVYLWLYHRVQQVQEIINDLGEN